MTVAELIKELAQAPDLSAEVRIQRAYTFYETDPAIRREIDKVLVPSGGGFVHAQTGEFWIASYALEAEL